MKILKTINDPMLIELIRLGKIGIIPTDTVYGIVCSATNKDAVRKLYQTKRPNENKPGTVIASNIKQLISLGIDSNFLLSNIEYFNKGITIISPLTIRKAYLNFDNDYIAVRLIVSGELKSILDATGPLLTTSANLPEAKTIGNIDEAQSIFKNNVDFYVDGGELKNRLPSTIIEINNTQINIIRRGSVTL